MRQSKLVENKVESKEYKGTRGYNTFREFQKEDDWRPVEGVQKCKGKLCKLCVSLVESTEVRSGAWGQRFKIGGRGEEIATCSSKDLVYLATCTNCGLQYVGHTIQKLRKRFGGHRAEGLRASKLGCTNTNDSTFFDTHFEQECGWESLAVQPVELLTDLALKTKREMLWASLLGTFYPYGLNDRIELLPKAPTVRGRMSLYVASDQPEKADAKGASLRQNIDRKGLVAKRQRKRERKRTKTNEEKEQITNTFDGTNYIEGAIERAEEGSGWVKDITNSEETLTKEQRKEVLEELEWMETEEVTRRTKQVMRLIEDKIRTTQGWIRGDKKEKTRPEVIWKTEFKNPTMEKLGLGGILRLEKVKNLLPTGLKHEPAVVFTYVQPTRRSILQYKKELIDSEGRSLDSLHW